MIPEPNPPWSKEFGPPFPQEFISFCIRFLADHDRGAPDGRPLLTHAGVKLVEAVIQTGHTVVLSPHWDRKRRKLWLGDQLLKEYRQPSPNQIAVLDAFEKIQWADMVIDPLPKLRWETNLHRQRRLHDAIKSLNYALPDGTIRFHGDGSGHGISWDLF
jgi:hypothetical protein